MKLEQLTKPQIILLWMTTCSKYQDALCEGDKEVLIRNKAFKDKKSISNALYQLHNAGYIKKFKDSWFILDAGKQHLQDAIAKLENESKAPKADECTDADFDFGITPEASAYIDKLENENARLKQELDAVNLQMKMREDEILDLRHDVSLYAKEYTTLRADFIKRNIAYDELAEENRNLKAQLENLKAQLNKSYTINIGACNEFAEACSKFIKSINTI